MSTANDAWQELKGEHPEAEQHWVFMAGYRQGLLDAASPALMVPSDELLKLADRWQYAAGHATSSASRVTLLSAIADLCALVDAATPAASVPAADKLEALREAVANYRTAVVARFQMGQTADPMTEIELAAGAFVDAVAAAEQADKGEAADTPRDEYDAHLGTTIAPAAPPEPLKVDVPEYDYPEKQPRTPASEPLCRCGHAWHWHRQGYYGCTWETGGGERCDCLNVPPTRVPVNDEAEAWPEQLRKVEGWHHAGLWNASCPGVPTNIHLTPPKQLEARCRLCGFALVAMDADGVAIHIPARQGGNSDE